MDAQIVALPKALVAAVQAAVTRGRTAGPTPSRPGPFWLAGSPGPPPACVRTGHRPGPQPRRRPRRPAGAAGPAADAIAALAKTLTDSLDAPGPADPAPAAVAVSAAVPPLVDALNRLLDARVDGFTRGRLAVLCTPRSAAWRWRHGSARPCSGVPGENLSLTLDGMTAIAAGDFAGRPCRRPATSSATSARHWTGPLRLDRRRRRGIAGIRRTAKRSCRPRSSTSGRRRSGCGTGRRPSSTSPPRDRRGAAAGHRAGRVTCGRPRTRSTAASPRPTRPPRPWWTTRSRAEQVIGSLENEPAPGRRDRRAGAGHRRPDPAARAERDHRGGPRRRAGPGLHGRGRRGQGTRHHHLPVDRADRRDHPRTGAGHRRDVRHDRRDGHRHRQRRRGGDLAARGGRRPGSGGRPARRPDGPDDRTGWNRCPGCPRSWNAASRTGWRSRDACGCAGPVPAGRWWRRC